MVRGRATVSYDTGAVRFFKEAGAWSKEMDTLQARLLTQ
jgi:hypothetical protein